MKKKREWWETPGLYAGLAIAGWFLIALSFFLVGLSLWLGSD